MANIKGEDLVKITWKFPNLEKAFNQNMQYFLELALATLQTQRGRIFDAEGAYNGRSKWKGLLFRNGMILSAGGARGLRGSIAPRNNGVKPAHGNGTIIQISGTKITLGSNLIYAKIHNEGGIIVPKNAKALRIVLPNGAKATKIAKEAKKRSTKITTMTKSGKKKQENVIFLKKVTIPKREYMDWTPQDAQELQATMANAMKKVFDNVKPTGT